MRPILCKKLRLLPHLQVGTEEQPEASPRPFDIEGWCQMLQHWQNSLNFWWEANNSGTRLKLLDASLDTIHSSIWKSLAPQKILAFLRLSFQHPILCLGKVHKYKVSLFVDWTWHQACYTSSKPTGHEWNTFFLIFIWLRCRHLTYGNKSCLFVWNLNFSLTQAYWSWPCSTWEVLQVCLILS